MNMNNKAYCVVFLINSSFVFYCHFANLAEPWFENHVFVGNILKPATK